MPEVINASAGLNGAIALPDAAKASSYQAVGTCHPLRLALHRAYRIRIVSDEKNDIRICVLMPRPQNHPETVGSALRKAARMMAPVNQPAATSQGKCTPRYALEMPMRKISAHAAAQARGLLTLEASIPQAQVASRAWLEGKLKDG